jgi:hypothetical protein
LISDSDEQTRYLDGVKSRNGRPRGYFSGTIEAFNHPRSFYDDVLTQKRTRVFDFCYRTMKEDGYLLHLVYNVLVVPSVYMHQQSIVESYSWDFTTVPLDIPSSWYGAAKTAHLVVDSSVAYSTTLSDLEDVLYGTDSTNPTMPTPQEVFDIFEENSILIVTDHGDGSFTVDGPDSAIIMLDSTTFQITWPSAVFIDAVSYTIHSL